MRHLEGRFEVIMFVEEGNEATHEEVTSMKDAIEAHALSFVHYLKAYLKISHENVGVNVFPIEWRPKDEPTGTD